MPQAQSQEQTDDSTDEEEYEIYPQATQHPRTIIAGRIVDGFVNPDQGEEDTGHSVGIVFENPTLIHGEIWRNSNIPDGFDTASEFNTIFRVALADIEDWVAGQEVTEEIRTTARERIAEVVDVDDWTWDAYEQHRLTTDYKLADSNDRAYEEESVTIDGEEHTTGISVGAKTFQSEQVDGFAEDKVMVWYRGMAAQHIIRALDFNGSPYARWKDDGYLTKGILQPPLGWFDRDFENYPDLIPQELSESDNWRTRRGQIASKRNGMGRPPRVVRPLVLREDIEDKELFIDIDRYQGSSALSATEAFNEGDWTKEEYIEAKAKADESNDNVFELIDIDGPQPKYEGEPEPILVDRLNLDSDEDIEYVYDMYEGEGWQPEPSGAFYGAGNNSSGGQGGSFDMPDGPDEDDIEHPTPQEVEFGEQLAELLAGTGSSPDDDNAFSMDGEKVDLEGVVGHNADQFDVTPDVDSIRRVIYENVSHLDVEDL